MFSVYVFLLTVTVFFKHLAKKNSLIQEIKDSMSNFCFIALNFGTCIYHTYEQTSTRAYHLPPSYFCLGRQSLDPGKKC